MPSRYGKFFVRGLFVGSGLVSAWLMISSFFSGQISLNVHPEISARESIVFSINNDSLSQARWNNTEETTGNFDLLVEDFIPYKPRNPLLVVIVTSLSRLERTLNTIIRTWGNETVDYITLVGSKNSPGTVPKDSNVFESPLHLDFPAFPYLSFKELISVLDILRDNFLGRYRWFLIGSSNLYVSVQHLEALVTSMNSNSLTCVGHPGNNEGEKYCIGGPGLLLSHLALSTMKGHVKTCKDGAISNGYQRLSQCLFQLAGKGCCHGDNPKLNKFFVYDKKVETRNTEKFWNHNYDDMMTFYPVGDVHHMETVHAFSQSREITYHQRTLAKLKQNLQSFCEHYPNVITCASTTTTTTTTKTDVTLDIFNNKCPLIDKGYVPEMRRKVVNWDTIVGNSLYTSWNMSPDSVVDRQLSQEIQYVTDISVSLVKAQVPKAGLERVTNMYARYRGTVGREYIVDMVFRVKDKFMEKRISLLLTHSDPILVEDSRDNFNSIIINFIVPLDGVVRTKMAKFMRAYEIICIRTNENCRIIFVLLSQNTNDHSFLKTYLVRFKRRHSQFSYELSVAKEGFDKTKAYEIGISYLKDEDLVFLGGGSSFSIAGPFLGRCRANALRGKQIYYPEIFRYYNMKYVYRGRWKPRRYDFSRTHGHWATSGVACLYKSDYSAIGGYATIGKWNTDPLIPTKLHEKLNIMIAPDPGVTHWFEDSRCDSKLSPAQFSTCMSQRSDDTADRTSLASYVLFLEQKCKR